MAAGVMPVMAAVSAGVAGYCAFSLAEARYRRNLHARASLQGRVAGGPLWWVRNGVKPLVSLARWLLRFPAVDAPMAEAVRLAERRGVAAAPESLLSALLAGGLGLSWRPGCRSGGRGFGSEILRQTHECFPRRASGRLAPANPRGAAGAGGVL